MENGEAMNSESNQIPKFLITVSHEAKLRELLRNITSIDLQLCSEATKEFMKLLRSDEGGEMLRQYVQTSPNCSELLQAWNFRQSKPGLSYIMSLINVILSHKDGVYKPNDAARVSLSRALDKFAHLIHEEKIGDVYKELNSKENKGKNAALLLMSSIVRRGSGLASEVAKSFNFKLPDFLKLAEYDKRRKNMETIKRKISTRRSYVRFAMSFLEIGDPRLLRWVLQQKEMFSGVLRGLGSDEEETAAYVLSVLKDKVLVPESLVPVALRSVLFGSVTLEQLVNISGRDDGGDAVDVAQKVLFMVCTDPSNGLMPDSKASPFPLKGNPTRLLGVMKKLKATEIEFHRDLLLAIVRGRPSLCSAYLDEFSYNLEDHTTWFAAVSLAANLISSVNAGLSFDFLDSRPQEPPSLNSSEVQSIIKCIGPRSFNRTVMDNGLRQTESQLIKHGTLRLVSEALNLLDSLFSAIIQRSKSSKQIESKWMSLKQDIQNEVQLLLPDPQVLLLSISKLNKRYKKEKEEKPTKKRNVDETVLLENNSSRKKLKSHTLNEETDIFIGGISDTMIPSDNEMILDEDNIKDSDNLKGDTRLIIELWESHDSSNLNMVAEDEESYLYSKLLDALKIYYRTMPSANEESFNFVKVLLSEARSLPTVLQHSLLSLLVEYIGWSSKQEVPIRYLPDMYKYLEHFIKLVIHSPVKEIKDQAYVLAQATMLSIGAFDKYLTETDTWFLFLFGFNTKSNEDIVGEMVQNVSSDVISFFCDAVTAFKNKPFKYLNLLRLQIRLLETTKDINPRFSSFFICVLENFQKILKSESFDLAQKSSISMYVSNTLKYLLQTQADAGLLSSIIHLSLTESLKDVNFDLCESQPLKSLSLLSKSIKDQESCMLSLIDRKKSVKDESSFLKQAPFHAIFPAIISNECLYISESSKLQDFYLNKLSKDISNNFVSTFRLVFFWFHQVQSSSRNEPTEEHLKNSEICLALIKHMLGHPAAKNYAQEIAETVFCHPVVINVLESPLSVNKKLKDDIFRQPTNEFLCLAKEGVHIMDYHIFQVLETFFNHFSTRFKPVSSVFSHFLQKLIPMLKNRLDNFINLKDSIYLIPTLFIFHILFQFISPQELLELVHWMFSRINESSLPEASRTSALAIGLNISGCAFDLLRLNGLQELDVCLFEKVYFQVIRIASNFDLVVADICMLKAVKVSNTSSGPANNLSQSMVISRIVANTPMNFVSKCFRETNMVKAQLLYHLTETSLLHLSFFGLPFVDIVNKNLISKKKKKNGEYDQELLMLLPTALSFLNYISMRYGQKCNNHLTKVRCLYSEILSEGFSNWKSFVSQDIFEVKLEKSFPSSLEELYDVFNNSLLGRTLEVIQGEETVKRSKRLKLCDSVLESETNNLLDCDASEIDHFSIDQSLNVIMKAVTKVNLCKMLLFPNGNNQADEMSNKEYSRSVLFVNKLVSTWRLIVKKFTFQSEIKDTNCSLFRVFQMFIQKIFMEVITKIHKGSDIKSDSVVNLEQLAKSCLLHRFEDPSTLEMLRIILNFETENSSMHIQILQLLLSHSQFASTIQSASNSSSSLQFGIIFRPMSSILRSLSFSKVDKSNSSDLYTKQLEIIKLVRVLSRFRDQNTSVNFEQNIGINIKELMFLLLSSYGATTSEKDLEIYKLINELETIDKSSYIADMNYLWGPAAPRVRKLQEIEKTVSSDDMEDSESIEKGRKSQFRENLPIDPRMCALTVLHFPYERNISHVCEEQTANINTRNVYDPVFILRMSLHGLSMEYIEPVEFANLGLLAVAFVSLSSPHDEIRKLGYKVLAIFRQLEMSQKRKELDRLRPLLTYVQNGISEDWQRIPSVHALFAAEASVLLLDPSNDHYKTIKRITVDSLMNTKTISIFDEFFYSSSSNFKSDRIWILRLLSCGLNLEDDAQIYVRNSILEKLLSFYSSSLSDNESRELILQIVKKSVKFDKTCRYLIEQCGLISWLSSFISNFCGSKYQEQRGVLLAQLSVILEVVNDIIATKNTIQWLETNSVEQITQLSCHLYMLFASSFEIVKEIHMVDSILEILSSMLKISQKRDAFQPHFTFSVEALYQLSQAVDECCNREYSSSAELGLKVVLMSTPQAAILNMDQEKLQNFVSWAVSIALKANSSDEQKDDSLLSKLLRWLTASVILGILYNHKISGSETLQDFLGAKWSTKRVESGSEEVLALVIYYLQQILGRKCEVLLTSVVGSLCLLLFSDSSNTDALTDRGSSLTSLLSRIRCPSEANPSWRWSFEQPLMDPSSVEEVEACQRILAMASNVLGNKSSLSNFLSELDLENSGVFEWEKRLIVEIE